MLPSSSEMGEWLLHACSVPTDSFLWMEIVTEYSESLDTESIAVIKVNSFSSVFAQLSPGCKSRFISDRRD